MAGKGSPAPDPADEERLYAAADAVLEWAFESTAWIEKIRILIRERKMTGVVDSLFGEVDDAGVPIGLALFLAALKEQDRYSTAYDLMGALFDAGKHDLCAMVEAWLDGDKAHRDEEEKQRYREDAARTLKSERRMWLLQQRHGWGAWADPRNSRPGARPDVLEITPERVECLAAKLRREWRRDVEKYCRAQEVRRALDVDMRAAAELPLEPPAVLERKALNQLDKRAKTRKLAGPKQRNDENKQRELRNPQTKARNQKRAKARANKLAATDA